MCSIYLSTKLSHLDFCRYYGNGSKDISVTIIKFDILEAVNFQEIFLLFSIDLFGTC